MSDTNAKVPSCPTPPNSARVWGWVGVIPFIILALLNICAEGIPNIDFNAAFVSYGVVILAFMGGIQWGLTMASGQDSGDQAFRFTMSIVPVLVALCAIIIPPTPAHIVLAVGFLVILLYDIHIAKKFSALGWYPRLRIPLTTAVLACITLNGMAL